MTQPSKRILRALALLGNLLTILCVLAGLWAVQYRQGRWLWRPPTSDAFCTFTVLSNVFLALACLLSLPFDLRAVCGGEARRPIWLTVLKFVGVCAVSVTFWTVLLFLYPLTRSAGLYRDTGFWLHLVAPALGALVFFLLEREGRLRRWEGLLGAVPVFLYGAVYFTHVIVRRDWEDFYYFNAGGHWPLSMAVMFAASVGLAFALRALSNRAAARLAPDEAA